MADDAEDKHERASLPEDAGSHEGVVVVSHRGDVVIEACAGLDHGLGTEPLANQGYGST